MPLTGRYEPSARDGAREQAETFEASGGTRAADLEGRPIVVLTSVGAKTGLLRKTPLIRIEHQGEYAILASDGGSASPPNWYHNVKKHPHVELQDGRTKKGLPGPRNRRCGTGHLVAAGRRGVARFRPVHRGTCPHYPAVRAEPDEGSAMTRPRTVGVLGSGPMGRGFAILLSRAGYEVTLGTRHPEAPELAELPATVRISSFPEAATSDIGFIAVAHSAARDLVTTVAPRLAAKTLITCNNAWIPADYAAAGLSSSLTEGSWIARLVPQTFVARAFSHIGQRYLVTKAITEPGKWAVSYATDGIASAATVEDLIRDMGYVPYLIGTLAESAPLDYDGVLSDRLLTPQEMQTALNRSGRDRRQYQPS